MPKGDVQNIIKTVTKITDDLKTVQKWTPMTEAYSSSWKNLSEQK